MAWNTLLLSGTKYPESYGGPNHDNTTHFGDSILLEYNASGTQRLIFQSSYWIQGHFSRFMRPGSVIVASSGAAAAQTTAQYEAIRNRTVSCRGARCPPAAGFPLLAVAYADAAEGTAGVVVGNVNAEPVAFTLVDTRGARHSESSIPAHSIQTYTFPTA